MSRASGDSSVAKRRHQAAVCAALGDETRLSLIAALAAGEPRSIAQLTGGTRITRQAITKHLVTLEQAGLVTAHETGRERRYAPHPEALQSVTSWIAAREAQWDHRLAALRSYLLDEPRTPSTQEEGEDATKRNDH